jgi:hypothetical protein
MISEPFLSAEMLFPGYLMQTVIPQMCPSSISKVWKIDSANKAMKIPKKAKIPVRNIIDKVIKPILSSEMVEVKGIYFKKITPFQTYCLDLIQLTHKTHNWKQKLNMNLSFYDNTITMINSNPIFEKNKASIIDTIDILRGYEMNIYTIIIKRLTILLDALKEIDEKDLLNSLYGSYMALLCFWYITLNEKQSQRTIPIIAEISHELAIHLEGYADTLDIMTNPEEIDMMKRAQEWERQNLQNRSR